MEVLIFSRKRFLSLPLFGQDKHPDFPTMEVGKLYGNLCASCHGAKPKAGEVAKQSMLGILYRGESDGESSVYNAWVLKAVAIQKGRSVSLSSNPSLASSHE
mgnify:CR=1 FL=1|jgi:hypothetical protein